MATAGAATGQVTAITRAWVTGPLGEGDALPLEQPVAPLVAVRRVEDGWEVALISRDPFVRERWRAWLRLLTPLHCQFVREIGAYWVSDHGMCQLTRDRRDAFGMLLGDATRAIVASANGR